MEPLHRSHPTQYFNLQGLKQARQDWLRPYQLYSMQQLKESHISLLDLGLLKSITEFLQHKKSLI